VSDATVTEGQSGSTAAVPVLGDTIGEPDETFRFVLTGAANATLADAEGQRLLRPRDVSTRDRRSLSSRREPALAAWRLVLGTCASLGLGAVASAAPVRLVDQAPVAVSIVAPGVVLVDFGRVAFGNVRLARRPARRGR